MTEVNLVHLKTTLMRGGYNKADALWKKAFVEYTNDTKIPLGMGCLACYRKVFNHLKEKYKS